MADLSNPQGYLQAYLDSLTRQEEALRQPTPRQGGFLSNADPVMLSLAAGLLSPTRTGSFGESIGSGLSAVQGPLAEMRRQEAARADKLASLEQAKAKLTLDFMELQQGGRRGYKPDEPNLVYGRYLDNLAALQAQKNMAETPEEEIYWQDQIEEYKKSNPKFASKKAERQSESKDVETPELKTKKTTKEPGSIPRLESPEEADSLPSGTLFYDPEGVLRKVP